MQTRYPSGLLKLVVLIAVMALLAACGGRGSAKPAAAPTQAAAPVKAVEPTAAPAPAQPTEAPQATEAPKPTAAPQPTEAPTPTEAPKPTAAPAAAAPVGGAALDLLMNAMRAQLAAKTWRATTTIEDGGKVTTNKVEFVAPSSMHMTTGASLEMIILKEGSYQKDKAGQWQKSPVDMSSIVSTVLDPKNVEELLKDVAIDKLKFIGPDLLNGKPTWVYQFATTTKVGDLTITGDSKIWVGVLDKLPYRSESESDSVVNKGAKMKTTTVYEYDPNIKIEAPIK